MKTDRRGFTLIELLIVISILGILAGLLIPIVSRALVNNKIARTQALVMVCEQACERYHSDYNAYPWANTADVKDLMKAGKPQLVEIVTARVFAELRGQGSSNTKENYLDGLESRFVKDLGAGETLVEAWGREIVFRVKPEDMLPVVYSVGPNGKDETADGTSTDPVTLPDIYYLFKSGDKGDDIPSR